MQLDIITILGIVSVLIIFVMIYFVVNKYKPRSIGDLFVALTIKETTLIFMFGIIIAAVAEALTASSIVAPGHASGSNEINPMGRYLAHGMFSFLSAVTMITAMHILSKIIYAFAGGLDKKSKWAQTKSNYAQYIFWHIALWMFLMTVGIGFIYQNGYLVAGNLHQVDLYIAYWRSFFNVSANNKIFAAMSSPLQVTVVTMMGHVFCSIVEGILAIYKLLFDADVDMHNILAGKAKDTSKDGDDIHKKIEKNEEKAKKTKLQDKLGHILNFFGYNAIDKKADLIKILEGESSQHQGAISAKIIALAEKVENYLKEGKSQDDNNADKKKLVNEIRDTFAKSPKEGGFGLTLSTKK